MKFSVAIPPPRPQDSGFKVAPVYTSYLPFRPWVLGLNIEYRMRGRDWWCFVV